MSPDLLHGFCYRHVVPGDEEGHDTGRAPGHPEVAVDQDLAPGGDGRVQELHYLREMSADVGLGDIHQPQPLIGDADVPVVLLAGVDRHPGHGPCTLRCVEDVSHPEPDQVLHVAGSSPEDAASHILSMHVYFGTYFPPTIIPGNTSSEMFLTPPDMISESVKEHAT